MPAMEMVRVTVREGASVEPVVAPVSVELEVEQGPAGVLVQERVELEAEQGQAGVLKLAPRLELDREDQTLE